MEPERKIEKLLRAYAKKRRAQAGDSLKLHPADRRILQGEAARRAPKPDKGGFFPLILATFRRKLAFALCVVAIALLGVSMFLPALSSKRKAQNFSAADNSKVMRMATRQHAENNKDVPPASLAAVTNELGTRKVLIDPVSGKPFVYAGAGKKLDGMQSNTVLAYSSVDKNGHAALFADERVETVSGTRFTELTNQKSLQLALVDQSARERVVETPSATAPVVAASPTPVLPSAEETKIVLAKHESSAGALAQNRSFDQLTTQANFIKPGSATSQQFVQTGVSNRQNLFKNGAPFAQTTPVLQSFQVQQNGDAISVVDRDGSVYNGSVQSESETVRNEPAPAKTFAARATPPQSQTKAAPLAGNEQQAAQNYFFRVAGMNRTLKQNVVFTGNMEAIPNVITNAQQTLKGDVGGFGGNGNVSGAGNQFQQNAANFSQQNLLSNSRIVGTAVIDNDNRVEINAVPATP